VHRPQARTQCDFIVREYGLAHISVGDVLRAQVNAGTPLGQRAKAYMDGRQLVPDELIIGLVSDRLGYDDCITRGWLLDGYPRTAAQATALAVAGIRVDAFIDLHVPDNSLMERIVGRRIDPDTGKSYHLKFDPCKDPVVAARLKQRADDTEAVMAHRLKAFHNNFNAVKQQYTKVMITIDGNHPQAKVYTAISEALKKL